MIANELLEAFEEFAPLALQEEWDNAGLLVGSRSANVTKALLALDVTEAVVDDAIKNGADIIISHHPLIFRPLRRLTGGSDGERAVIKAIRAGILVYACHTNIDAAAGGVSYRMGGRLSLEGMRPLAASGLGVVGELGKALVVSDFAALLKKKFECGMVRYTDSGKRIKRVAMCGGSGAGSISDAIAAGADAFVSADFKYHDFFLGGDEIALVDIGHYESEQYTLEIFYDIISKKFPTFAVQFTSVNSNPVKYI